jgi:hypothetical protein
MIIRRDGERDVITTQPKRIHHLPLSAKHPATITTLYTSPATTSMQFLRHLDPRRVFRRRKSRYRGSIVENVPYGTGHIQYSCQHDTPGFWRAQPAERYYTTQKCPACRFDFDGILTDVKDWFKRAGDALCTIPVGPRENRRTTAATTAD